VPLLNAEAAWTVTLPSAPSAAGAMDDRRIYIALREGLIVALDRDTGLVHWTRPLETSSPLLAAEGLLFVVGDKAIRALNAADGADQWVEPIAAAVTAPLSWDSGWLIAITGPGDVMALRGADGAVIWRRSLGAASTHRAVAGGAAALYFALGDGRLVALALTSGEPLWEQRLVGTISEPATARDRVFVGSTDNFFYAFDADSGRPEWKWRNGGDVIGAASDDDLVYFASLDNLIRAVNRGNGNQRWRMPTGTRPVAPPRAFAGIVVLPGLMPAITAFIGKTGVVMGTHAAAGDLVGPALIDPLLEPRRVAIVMITREGVVEALRPSGRMFRETALVPIAALPGRPLARERIQ
jgi:outer membrane protein assembly factor BamB